jgi:hypothetical protein
VDFNASEEDVVMRLEALGDQLRFWVWPADEARPEAPLVVADGAYLLGGAVGVIADDTGHGDGGKTNVEFRYFDATMIPEPSPGDFDGDGLLTATDIDLLSAEVRRELHPKPFDLNGDNFVNSLDHEDWVHELRNTWFGDADLDGEFNTGDLTQVLEAGKYETSEYASWSEGDWNGDGTFGTGDLVMALGDGGYEKGPLGDAVAVPEPGAWLLLVMGLLAWLIDRRGLRPNYVMKSA